MIKKLVLALFLLFNLFVYSQEIYNSESYRVTLDDIKSTTFTKDSTANALVIYERGNSYLDRNKYYLKTEVQHKIKILNREGFDKANVTIHLYNNDSFSEKVTEISGTTYNLIDGNVVKTNLNDKDVFEEKYDDNHTFVKFTLPNIKEGSVITYSYTLTSAFMFNYKSWNFQSDIPKLYSEYNASIPANWNYHIKLIGGRKLFINESKVEKECLTVSNGGVSNCFNTIYAMKDIPSFTEEDYMTTKGNYLARIEYELKTFVDFEGVIHDYAKTWETVDDELKKDENIGRQLSKSIKVDEILPTEILNEPDALKKSMSIYKFVQDQYTWNEEYRIFKDVSVKDLLKNKSGNVSSINILLHNLLEGSGVEVKPLLLSTRNNGFATQIFPVISEFNYLIVQATIDNKTYYLDATDDYLSFGEIPFRCLNLYGRLLDFKNGSNWIDIEPENPSSVLYNIDLNFNDNQSLTGQVKSKTTGYHALNSRKSYFPNREAYVKRLEDNAPYIEIFDHSVPNDDKTSPDFSESYSIEYTPENTGETLFINPFFTKFFSENPFKLQERSYPIDFGFKDSYLYMLNLNFGDGYIVLETPKDILLALPNNAGQLLLSTKVIGNSIRLLMKIDFKLAIYPPEFYPYLKEFMGKIVDTQKNSLILLKKV